MELGDLAGWVSGIASVVAVATAFWFWARDRRDQKIAMYTNVSMWAQWADGTTDEWVVKALNNTSSPIWSWRLTLTWKQGDEEYYDEFDSSQGGLLPPGNSEFRWTPKSAIHSEANVRPRFYFQDPTGTNWMKSCGAGLKKINYLRLSKK